MAGEGARRSGSEGWTNKDQRRRVSHNQEVVSRIRAHTFQRNVAGQRSVRGLLLQ